MGSDALERPVTVAVIEDIDVVVEGVRSWIASDPQRRATVVAVADTVEAILDGPGREADVLVLDLELGDVMVTPRVAELSDAGYRVVVYSVHVEPLVVKEALAAGACAFLDKRTEKAEFVDMIVDVAHDRPHVTQSMAGGILQSVDLSGREREALLLLFQGMTYASMARRMTKPGDSTPISRETAKQYVERARAKLAATGRPCRSNFALLARCIELGLIRPDQVADYRSAAHSE
ncbi:MAG: response regulator [Micromonosporaceae bacterium]